MYLEKKATVFFPLRVLIIDEENIAIKKNAIFDLKSDVVVKHLFVVN